MYYVQKAIVHNAHTLHTVRNVHNAHCAYRFKVKSCDCINFVRAIDPPYNTGSDFVYPDNFSQSIESYKEITGQLDEEHVNLTTNSESAGRYHTDWLNMMYPRLRLARGLLSDDGVIFISIDDNEIDNLKKLCNEIFGDSNFIATYIKKSKIGGGK